MLLIGPIARYLLAEHGPGYCVVSRGRPHGTTQEAGYDVGQSGGRPHGTICRNSNVEQHFFVAFFFCLMCGCFKKKEAN